MADRIKITARGRCEPDCRREVVNRPSSVVKEMMENAIDAGARSVKVNFRDGGKELIQNRGRRLRHVAHRRPHGFRPACYQQDLFAGRYLCAQDVRLPGRGARVDRAVSQVELRTRQAEDEVGTLTTVNGGEFVSQTLAACPVGSQFYVRNLFYNVPARRKFLEKSTTSTGQIKSEFQRVALCNPQVGFELLMNDQPLYRLPLLRWLRGSSMWWGVISNRTCWKSMPTRRSCG